MIAENDKKIIKELIEKYGSPQIEKFIRQEKLNNQKLELLMLEYLYTTNFDPTTKKYVNPCVSIPTENNQYFSNGISSIFELNDQIIEKDWLTLNRKIITKPIIFDHQKNLENKMKVEN